MKRRPYLKQALRPENVLFWALLVAHLIPIWGFRYFPSQDGPAHLENAAILRDYSRSDRPLLHEFYAINPNPDPNWFSHLFLAALMYVVPPLVAEKILLTAHWLLLPLSFRYAVRSVRPDAGYLAVFAFPLANNMFLHMGFYNFCFSVGFYFLVVGYWLRHRDQFTVGRTLVLTALVLGMYFCHLVAVAAAGLTLGIGVAYRCFRPHKAPHSLWRALVPLAAFLPAVLLGAWFVWRPKGMPLPGIESDSVSRALGLVKLEALVSFTRVEGACAWVLGVGLWLVAAATLANQIRTRRLTANNEMLLCVAAMVVVYFLAPDATAGGSFLFLRLGLLTYFALLFWLAGQTLVPRVRWGMQIGAALVSLALLGLHTASYWRLNALLDDYVACAPLLEPQKTLLPISFDHTGHAADVPLSVRVGAFRHAAGYLAAERGVINLLNYEPSMGYFPIRYNPAMKRSGPLPGEAGNYGGLLFDQPPYLDVAGFTRRTGQTVDYILLWGLPAENRRSASAHAVLKQVEMDYERIYPRSSGGLVQLYRRRERGEIGVSSFFRPTSPGGSHSSP
jgi:hypothetical protein